MKLLVRGGERVFGRIKCGGAKNFANKAILACLLSNETSCLENMPNIGETEIIFKMLQDIGVLIRKTDNFVFITPDVVSNILKYPDNRTNRIPILMLGILIHRFDRVFVPHLGGDQIGLRAINFHIEMFEKFGCTFEITDAGYNIRRNGPLQPAYICFDYPSVGATENAIFTAVLTKGTSRISNIAIEPEIISLIEMLNKMGASIRFIGVRDIIINGVETMHSVKFKIIGDRIEAASWACMAAASNGEIEVIGCDKHLLYPFIDIFQEAGGLCTQMSNESFIFSRTQKINPINIRTDVFPGFSTDWQAPLAIMLSQGQSVSYIHDTVHDNRFGYIKMLECIGFNASIHKCIDQNCRYYGHTDNAVIRPSKLCVTKDSFVFPITDIRAGLAYLIAAVVADGCMVLSEVDILDRGYGNIVNKLLDTNINIKFCSDDQHVAHHQIQYSEKHVSNL